jgi:hypothetical protein
MKLCQKHSNEEQQSVSTVGRVRLERSMTNFIFRASIVGCSWTSDSQTAIVCYCKRHISLIWGDGVVSPLPPQLILGRQVASQTTAS